MLQKHYTRRLAEREGDDLAADMARGAVAGAVATFVLDRVDWFVYGLEPEWSQRQTWEVRPEHKDPAHVIASKIAETFGAGPIPQGHAAGLAVHYAIGITPAALYGALPRHAGGGLIMIALARNVRP